MDAQFPLLPEESDPIVPDIQTVFLALILLCMLFLFERQDDRLYNISRRIGAYFMIMLKLKDEIE